MRNRQKQRRGAALMELAICLPLLMMLVFSSIEASSMIFLKQSLAVAAYEGLRTSIRPEGSEAAGIARCEEILDARGVNSYTVSISPDPAATPRGQYITLRVETPSSANSLLPGWFFGGKTVFAENSMVKE